MSRKRSTQAEIDALIAEAKGVIARYPKMRLTVRQIYYALVSKHFVENSPSGYALVKRILKIARESKKIPYAAIEDRTRKIVRGEKKEESPESYFTRFYSYLKNLDGYYQLPRWWGQSKRVVVCLEKEALSGVFQKVTDEHAVDLVTFRGYPSITQLWELAQELGSEDKEIEILYFGDFDPSGVDIERAAMDKLEDKHGIFFSVERIALTKAQVTQYNLPPDRSKPTDSRQKNFIREQGVDWQVELDALDPNVLNQLIEDAIESHFDTKVEAGKVVEQTKRRIVIREYIDDALNPSFTPPNGRKP